MFRGRDPSLHVDATGYFYGDDLLGATESGRWVDYVLLNPKTGDDLQKHTWAVRYDGLIFARGGTNSSQPPCHPVVLKVWTLMRLDGSCGAGFVGLPTTSGGW